MEGNSENGKKKGGFLTVDEAAELVGLSHWTIRVWIHRGRLTKYKAASRIVVSRSELLALVKPRREEQAK
jgi:excisionase family DNA binding protein